MLSVCNSDCITVIIKYLIWDIKKEEIIGVYYSGTKKWHIGVVLKCSPTQVLIHYIGWGSNWDEWKSIDELMPYDHRLNCNNIDHTEYSFYLDRLLHVKKGENSIIKIERDNKTVEGEIISYPFENGIWYIEYNTINKYRKKIKHKMSYDELIRYSASIYLNSGATIYSYLFCKREYEELITN